MVAGDGTGTEGVVRRPVFRRRAANVLLLGTVVAVVVLGFVLWALATATPGVLPSLVLVAGPVATGVTFYLVSISLDRGREWAPGAAVLVLWVVLGMGVLRMVVALVEPRIDIPLDAIVAAWALSAWDRPARSDLTDMTAPTLAPALVVLVATAGTILAGAFGVSA